nr:unnamed protein product [Digitaria exilis]
MAPFTVAPLRTHMQHQHELHFHLYLHRNVNNLTVASTHHGGCDTFGNLVVNDWPIYDGHGHGAKVVAHAQGLHIHSSKEGNGTSNSFTILFQVER